MAPLGPSSSRVGPERLLVLVRPRHGGGGGRGGGRGGGGGAHVGGGGGGDLADGAARRGEATAGDGRTLVFFLAGGSKNGLVR